MTLEICEYLKRVLFAWTLSIDQMPADKDNCRKIDLSPYLGEKNKTWDRETLLTKQLWTVGIHSQICNRKGGQLQRKIYSKNSHFTHKAIAAESLLVSLYQIPWFWLSRSWKYGWAVTANAAVWSRQFTAFTTSLHAPKSCSSTKQEWTRCLDVLTDYVLP